LAKWSPEEQRWALTQFAVIASLVAFSYGLWQAWFQVLIALSSILTAAALRVPHDRPPTGTPDLDRPSPPRLS
jgi:hypothetical protein